MQSVAFPNGEKVPQLGQGTWQMGVNKVSRNDEIAALRLGIELGMTLIDTAEMYAEGGAEEVVGEAIAGRRETVFVVTKVYPHNASRTGAIAACERSLKRLAIDRIDLYLLHWQGTHPLADTVEAFEALRKDGKIGQWGVSNFDVKAMATLSAIPGGTHCATNQVLYHLAERGIEHDLLPDAAKRGLPVMAYTPLGGAKVVGHRATKSVAERHGVTPAAVALAWTMRRPDVISIPKSAKSEHVRANAKAATLALSPQDFTELNAAFPPPRRAMPLAMG